MRIVLLVLFATVLGCGRDSAAPPPIASRQDVGKVIEFTGMVVAVRDGVTRTLALGNPVAADDVIRTGNGSIVILLFHNNARWSLEAGLQSRVDESVAWALPKQEAAESVDHATSSAGRHADRQAAETDVTADVANAQTEADRNAAKAKLDQLRKDKVQMEARIAAAKAEAARAERKKGVRISKECMENPLAKGCGGDEPAEDPVIGQSVAKLEAFTKEVCACKDSACAKRVDQTRVQWRTALDAIVPPGSKSASAIAERSKDTVARYTACLTKLAPP